MEFKATAALILIVLFSGCQSWKEDSFPHEIVGVWETEETRYDGCFFEIIDNKIIFSNSNEDYTDINTITGIQKTVEQDKTLYLIEFENNEGLEFKCSLFYMKRGSRDWIQFKNQEKVQWVRSKDTLDSENTVN